MGWRIAVGPFELTAMQASLTEPNARAIPDQELEAMLAFVAKGVSTAITGCAA